MPPKQEVRSRPQTKRKCIRLNELVETINQEKGVLLFRKEVNLGNYKILWIIIFLYNFYFCMKKAIESGKLPSFRTTIEKRISANDQLMTSSKP